MINYLLIFLKKERCILLSNDVSLAINHKNNKHLNKSNFGNFLKEGSLVDEATEVRLITILINQEFLIKSSGKNIVWVFGDSWGYGIKKNELKNKTIEKALKNNFSKLRIIESGSWSPILMNIAFKHYSDEYNEVPDIVAIYIKPIRYWR